MIKLTAYAPKGGCACKIGPHILDRVLKDVTWPMNDRVLVGFNAMDDGGVYGLNEELGLVQTLDFFTPIVDDPRLFGKIAAANSISDVYAMGGTPITAMNIVGFPVPLVEQGVLTEVLLGASEVLEEAGVAVLGGHSIENEVPIFGMSVTGLVRPDAIWKNGGAQEGDVVILTKALGTGIMSTALKGGLYDKGVQEAVTSMTTTNRRACEIGGTFTVHACTDITGFSLLGHSAEMAKASGVSIHLNHEALPIFSDVLEAAAMGLVPAATYGNRKAVQDVCIDERLDGVWSDICYDPQTSGGLLLAVPQEEGQQLLDALHQGGIPRASIIGSVTRKDVYSVYVA